MNVSRLTMAVMFIAILGFVTSTTFGHAHTHIGVNKDDADNPNQLWIFATGSQHQWDTIELLPTGYWIQNKQVYQAELNCWHSAHPPHGKWQLGGAEQSQEPDWDIGLRLVDSSDEDNFWMEYQGNYYLKNINDENLFSDFNSSHARYWMDNKYNENGELGAWGLHVHVEFAALAAGPGEEFSISLVAYDDGTFFEDSDPYTMTFVTIPEPATVLMLTVGGLSILRRRKLSVEPLRRK